MALKAVAVLMVLAAATVGAFHVEVQPRGVLFFRKGDRQEIRCVVKNCGKTSSITWSVLKDMPAYASFSGNSTVYSIIFDPVMEVHGQEFVCKVKCGTENKQGKARVKVYSFPTDPVIQGHTSLNLNGSNTLGCSVPDVYPREFLEVQWLQDGVVLQTHSSQYTFPALTAEDNGRSVTCRATLGLEGLASDQSTRETTVSLSVLYPPRFTRLPSSASVGLGEGVALACEAEGHPEPAVTWTAFRQDGPPLVVGQGNELVLTNVTRSHAGIYQCQASNSVSRIGHQVAVTVQAPPTNTSMVVSPQGPIMEGERVTISCRADSLQGGSLGIFRVSDGQRTPLQRSDESWTSFTLPNVLLADSGPYECGAVNDYGAETATAVLAVQVHPLDVELSPKEDIIAAEIGSSLLLSCHASGCPDPEVVWKDPQGFPVRSSPEGGGSVSRLYLSPVALTDEGVHTCQVKCGSVMKSRQAEVKVFSFPGSPVITSSGPSLAGQAAAFHCTVYRVYPSEHFQVDWFGGGERLGSHNGSATSAVQNMTVTLSAGARVADQGRRLTCRVTFRMDGVPNEQREKSAETLMIVHYPPQNTSITANPSGDLKEGDSLSISCRADGRPVGGLRLFRVSDGQRTMLESSSEGWRLSVTLPSVLLQDAGLYECEAVNQYGSEKASARVAVKSPPRNTTVEVFPSTRVLEGQNVTICCRFVSFPPPAVVLSKVGNGATLSSPSGTFVLSNLGPSDAGLYQVNVTNDLGCQTEIFTISVISLSTVRPLDFVVPAIGLGAMLASAGLLLEFVRRARRKGSYMLTKCTSSSV
ncbi:vascular cell adhesion protein 1b [Denticeps clupeoides]|uniref:Ig-like domain-containing protein n=1 Tax=Denticeps clupeoides TaxID=299321 RepID=A0AAY4BCQ3_9TELE|nr:vascular cell adhesion protein 1 [Denticeps clupeoides]